MVILIGVVFALLYLIRREFMPYHADAVEKSWDDLGEKNRILIIALMRVAGGGWMASSLAIGLWMYVYIVKGDPFASIAMIITGLSVSIPTLIATLIVKRRTKANPPIFAVVAAIVLLLAGMSMVLVAL
ncbi:MAG: hypothetical protein ACWGNV_12495 [Bacteroidales bacterium]